MRRALKTLCLCVLACACLSVAALATESNTLPGWEAWDTANYGSHVTMVCPGKDCTETEILADVSELIAENQGAIEADYRQFQMRYYYTRPQNTFSGVVNFMVQKVIPAVGGLWPCPETYANVTVSVGKTTSEYYLNVTVDMNGGSEKTTALYETVKEVGDAASASSENTVEQLRYISKWLASNVRYQNSGAPHENEAYGAIAEGRAVCGGYTEAVTLFCRYLGVTSATVRSSSHIWNRVFVDGAWKHWDATWVNGAADSFLTDYINDSGSSHIFEPDVLTQDQINARERAQYYNAPAALYHAARTLNKCGILRGDSNGFSLNSPLTRGQLAVILTRLHCPETESGAPAGVYTDAPEWAAAGIEWCVREGYMLPVGAEHFGADSIVTWQELCAVFGLEDVLKSGCVLRSDMVLQAIKVA